MREDTLQDIILLELKKVGYNPRDKFTVTSGYTGDIYIAETNTVIEVKTLTGSFRKGIGQCLSYELEGHNSAIFTKSKLRRDRKLAEYSEIPMVNVKPGVVSSTEFNCLANKEKYRELFDRLINPDRYEYDEVKTEYEKYAPEIDWE